MQLPAVIAMNNKPNKERIYGALRQLSNAHDLYLQNNWDYPSEYIDERLEYIHSQIRYWRAQL